MTGSPGAYAVGRLPDFPDPDTFTAQLVPLIPLWQRKEYVLSTEDITGGQYLSDGTGVFRLWQLGWV